MVVGEMYFHFVHGCLILHLHYPGFQPPSFGMIGIHSVVESDGLVGLPLTQQTFRPHRDTLIILSTPPWIVYIDGSVPDKDYFCIDPLLHWIQHIDILTSMPLLLLLKHLFYYHVKSKRVMYLSYIPNQYLSKMGWETRTFGLLHT